MKEMIVNGDLYHVHQFAGTVEQASKNLETRVSGDEKSTTSKTITHDDIFLVDHHGREMVLRLQNWNIACRKGHELRAVWLERAVPDRVRDWATPRNSYVLVHNVTTDTSTWCDWAVLYPKSSVTLLALLWGIPILLAGAATAGIGLLLIIFPKRQYIKAREDIVATKSELMRLIKSD